MRFRRVHRGKFCGRICGTPEGGPAVGRAGSPARRAVPVDVVSSLEGHADIYHATISALEISEPPNVFGIFMGGLAALHYAKKNPTRSGEFECLKVQ